jgi:hypothetical protein
MGLRGKPGRMSFFVFHAQMSPISPFAPSYQPRPAIASAIDSHNSCELVDVSASSGVSPPAQPGAAGIGHDGVEDLPRDVVVVAAQGLA